VDGESVDNLFCGTGGFYSLDFPFPRAQDAPWVWIAIKRPEKASWTPLFLLEPTGARILSGGWSPFLLFSSTVLHQRAWHVESWWGTKNTGQVLEKQAFPENRHDSDA
jgi:hypothetical protein